MPNFIFITKFHKGIFVVCDFSPLINHKLWDSVSALPSNSSIQRIDLDTSKVFRSHSWNE